MSKETAKAKRVKASNQTRLTVMDVSQLARDLEALRYDGGSHAMRLALLYLSREARRIHEELRKELAPFEGE